MGCLTRRTASSDQEGYQEPCPGPEHLPGVEGCCDGEHGDEDPGCGHGGLVVVELKGVEAAAGLAGQEGGLHRCDVFDDRAKQ